MIRSVAALLVALAVALLPPAPAVAPLERGQGGDLPTVVASTDCCGETDSCPDQPSCADMSSCVAAWGASLSALPAEAGPVRLAATGAGARHASDAQLPSAATAPPFRPPALSIRT